MEKMFSNDLVLQSARDKSFQSFLNEYDKATFFLAFHSDILLKSDQNYTGNKKKQKNRNIYQNYI